MKNDLFYNHVKPNDLNKNIVTQFELYANQNPNLQFFLLTSPLGEDYSYDYEDSAIIVLSPGFKILFIDLAKNKVNFNNYVDDVIQDLNSISDKYNYMKFIGRSREWRDDLINANIALNNPIDDKYIENLLNVNKLKDDLKRKSELLISLLTGSINDVEKIGANQPESILEKIKNKIILFDGEQTRFMYRDYEKKKLISVQGLSGTGKTELLLHKLKDLYVADDETKIFFTCHNEALADKLRQRIPRFFDFMKVNKQIQWNKRLWVNRAWGAMMNGNSGFYSYICHKYQLQFHRYSKGIDYQYIFQQVYDELVKIPKKEFKPCFDYILVDESQDFPDVFFDVCQKVVKGKVYIAGDVFQDIFETVQKKARGVDIVLNRCYRTDPRTLMFAHAVGLGLFEQIKFNWFEKKGWERLGYTVSYKSDKSVTLSRKPIKRFEDVELPNSTLIVNDTEPAKVLSIITDIKKNNSTLKPGDIAIIILDNNSSIYSYIDKICYKIETELNWNVSRGYESKSANDESVYITNPNNVKGLEFPFVICVTNRIQDTYKYRNSLYTMLTRSFLQSYLLIKDTDKISNFEEGLKNINENRCIKTIEPSDEQKKLIEKNILEYKTEDNESYQDFINKIYDEMQIPKTSRDRFTKAISGTLIDSFDEEKIKSFIELNKDFYV